LAPLAHNTTESGPHILILIVFILDVVAVDAIVLTTNVPELYSIITNPYKKTTTKNSSTTNTTSTGYHFSEV
jgi:hypothetical protein